MSTAELARATRRRIVLINPNTNAATTDAMVAIARAAGPDVEIEGLTAQFGAPLITTPEQLHIGAQAVEAACADLAQSGAAGVIISAFGDPGLAMARQRLAVPVTGLAEAAMRAAAAIGRFTVVTTTPALAGSIADLAARYGCADAFVSVRLTEGDPAETMREPARLVAALEGACREALRADDVAALVIGGGPLAAAAKELSARLPVPVIEPIPAAVARIRASLR